MQSDPTAALAVVTSASPAIRTADELAGAFLAGYRPATREQYARDLRSWGRFLSRVGVDVLAAHRVDVEAYCREAEAEGIALATLRRRLSALSGFYDYALDEGLIARSPVARVRRPKVADESPRLGLDREQTRALLDAGEASNPRDAALACLLAVNGLRVSEALAAEVDDLGHERGHRTLAVDRKGAAGKVRVPLAPRTTAALDLWLDARAQQLPADSGPLFYKVHRHTCRIEQLGRRDVHRWVRSLGRAAVPHKLELHPHDLRHAFVTLALDAGVSLRDVQDSAGHASPLTTRRYDLDRGRIDRHATYTLASYLGGGA